MTHTRCTEYAKDNRSPQASHLKPNTGGPFLFGYGRFVDKPSKSLPSLSKRLLERGLVVDDAGRLGVALYNIGYFRLSGYWRYFQEAPHMGDNKFRSGATLAAVLRVYEFDAQLRNILLEGLCEVEVALRARLVSHFCAEDSDGMHYLEPSAYSDELDPDGLPYRDRLLIDIADNIARSKEPHVIHYRDKGQVPMWVGVEALSLGATSKMFRLMADADERLVIAKRFGYPDADRLSASLHSLSILRNICAHHGRVWNRRVQTKPFVLHSIIKSSKDDYMGTPWGWMAVLAHLVSVLRHNDSFQDDLDGHAAAHPDLIEGLKLPHSR